MKGPSCGAALRARVLAVFASAFVLGSVTIFGAASALGSALRVGDYPLERRAVLAAAGFIALAFLDLFAIRRRRYCPLGLRRQTPRSLRDRYGVTAVVAAWGFDTGLAVTTFRVAAITWAALVMTGLGLSSWLVGLGYGLGFVLPLLFVLLTQEPDRPGVPSPVGPRLEGFLRKRPLIQSVSALLLLTSGGLLLIRSLA